MLADTMQTVYVSLYAILNSLVFKIRLNELNSSADWYDSEFQSEGALTLKAFAENTNAIRGTDSNSLSDDQVL